MPLNRSIVVASVMAVSLALGTPTTASARDTNGDGLELILIPIAFHGGSELMGLKGTRWRGEVWFHNESARGVQLKHIVYCDLEGCDAQYPGGYTDLLDAGLGNLPDHGILLSPSSEEAQQLTFSSRFFETTAHAQPLGIDVPVVREDQFLRGPAYLLALPGGDRNRTSLRIYDPHRENYRIPQTTFLIEIIRPERNALGSGTVVASGFVTTLTPPYPDGGPGYGAIYDLGATFPVILSLASFHIRITPTTAGDEYWTMASATDNDTQSVLLVIPH